MSAIFPLLRGLCNQYLPLVVSHLLASTLFLALILTVLAAHRHLTARSRFLLALIGIAKFAIPSGVIAAAIRVAGLDLFADRSPLPFRAPLQALSGAFRFHPAPPASAGSLVVVAIWMAVSLVLMIRLALKRHRLVSLSVRTALPPEPREVEALARARKRAGVKRSIDIARSATPEAPAVLRIIRPLIVLPTGGCDELSDDELEALLCHECAHVARHDNLISRIESFICALFWFHPLIWIAQRVTVIERERACDEVVAESADARETYLTALAKFCHAAIAPRLPGVSCMATAKLKQRMDHVMNYETLKHRAPSTGRVIFLTVAGLILFTIASGLTGRDQAFATSTKKDLPYSIKIGLALAGQNVTLQAAVTERSTSKVILDGNVAFPAGEQAEMKSGDAHTEVFVMVRPSDSQMRQMIEVIVKNDEKIVQTNTFWLDLRTVTEQQPSKEGRRFSGETIDLKLKDADIRDVVGTFGKLTNLEIKVDPSVEGTVSVSWENVPWDEAFDGLIRDHDLTYRIEGKTIYVSKK